MQQVSYTIAGHPLEVIGADDKPVKRALVADIIALASKLSGIAVRRIKGKEQYRPLVRVRWAIYAIAREHGHSYPRIARMFGKDHSTVVHGCQSLPDHTSRDPVYAAFVAELREVAQASAAAPFHAQIQATATAMAIYAPPPIKVLPPRKAKNVFVITRADKDEGDGLDFRVGLREGNRAFIAALAVARV